MCSFKKVFTIIFLITVKCLFFGAGLIVVVFQVTEKVFLSCVLCKTGLYFRNEHFSCCLRITPCIFGHFRKPRTEKLHSQSVFGHMKRIF